MSIIKLKNLTADRLREVLTYDCDTGQFTWRGRPAQCVHVGDTAGALCQDGYRRIRVDGPKYLSHRLAWLYVHGEWPAAFIDHINGNRSDNRIANLRDVSKRANMHNQRKAAAHNRSTGVLGVSKSGNRITAQIRVDGALIGLGSFTTISAASDAYLSAKRELHNDGCTL